MQILVDRLADELGQRIRCGVKAHGLRKTGSGYVLDGSLNADAVVLACPSYEAAGIVEELDRSLGSTLREIPYSPLAVVCLGFPKEQMPHPMNGFGFLVPRNAGLRILGALWTSSLFSGRAPDDQVLVRVMIGGARDPDVLEMDDPTLTALVLGEIAKTMGNPGSPSFARIFRHRCGIPQYTIGHAERLQCMDAHLVRHPGLFITGNAYLGIGVNDCARNAWPVARQVMDYLQQR
jgi:oxygen-dependent protoporphyrinogen oxidase